MAAHGTRRALWAYQQHSHLAPYRRQRLARAIMLELILKARELDLAYLDLDASPEVQPLYESLGFALTQAHHPSMKFHLK